MGSTKNCRRSKAGRAGAGGEAGRWGGAGERGSGCQVKRCGHTRNPRGNGRRMHRHRMRSKRARQRPAQAPSHAHTRSLTRSPTRPPTATNSGSRPSSTPTRCGAKDGARARQGRAMAITRGEGLEAAALRHMALRRHRRAGGRACGGLCVAGGWVGPGGKGMHQKDPQGGVSATRAMLRRWILPHSSVFQGSRSRWRAARPRSGFCGKRSMQVQMYTHMTRCSPVLPEHWGKVSCHAVQPVLLPCTDISSRRARSQEFAQSPPISLARNRPANALARYPEPECTNLSRPHRRQPHSRDMASLGVWSCLSHGLTGGSRTTRDVASRARVRRRPTVARHGPPEAWWQSHVLVTGYFLCPRKSPGERGSFAKHAEEHANLGDRRLAKR